MVCATLLAWFFVILNGNFSYGNALALAVLSGIVEGLYFVTVTLALAQAPIAISYSIMRSLSMLITWLLSYLILQEQLSWPAVLGVTFIIIGLTLPILEKRHNKTTDNTKYFWSYICALTIVAYNFIYNRALRLDISPLLLFATSLSIALPILYLFLKKEEKLKIFQINLNFKTNKYPVSFLIGSILFLSFTSFLYGLKDTLPAIALTVRNTSIPFALIISSFLGEKLRFYDFLVLIFILIGVFIVSVVSISIN